MSRSRRLLPTSASTVSFVRISRQRENVTHPSGYHFFYCCRIYCNYNFDLTEKNARRYFLRSLKSEEVQWLFKLRGHRRPIFDLSIIARRRLQFVFFTIFLFMEVARHHPFSLSPSSSFCILQLQSFNNYSNTRNHFTTIVRTSFFPSQLSPPFSCGAYD